MTSTELRKQWETSSILKAEWDAVVNSKAWKFVRQMIELEETERAETYETLHGDPVLARNLAGLKSVRRALNALENACVPEPVAAPLPEEFSHLEPPHPK